MEPAIDPATGRPFADPVKSKETPTQAYSDAVTAIAAGVKTLTDAGMSGLAAGDLALNIYCATNGLAHPLKPKA
jgi:hypothetical protein